MSRFPIVVSIIGCALLFTASNLSAEDGSDQYGDFWKLALTLDTPDLAPSAVQIAIFDTDPVQFFRYRMIHDREHNRNFLAKSQDKALARRVQATVAWDAAFDKIKGSRISLLTAAPDSLPGLVVTANDGGGRKWIITKVRETKDGSYCWCLPVDLTTGQKTSLTLTESNAFNLDSLYNEMMK